MFRPTSWLLPLAVLGLLVGLTLWLNTLVQPPVARADGSLRHDPDAIVEKFDARKLGVDGRVLYTLAAKKMVHYPDDDSALLESLTLEAFEPRQPKMTVTADHGRLEQAGERVWVEGNVVLVRDGDGARTESARVMPPTSFSPGAARCGHRPHQHRGHRIRTSASSHAVASGTGARQQGPHHHARARGGQPRIREEALMRKIASIVPCILLPLAFGAAAEKADREKKIVVNADRLVADDAKKTSAFEGNVVVTQGTMRMTAAKVTVREDPEHHKYYVANGSPVTFRQKLDNSEEWVMEGYVAARRVRRPERRAPPLRQRERGAAQARTRSPATSSPTT